MAVENSILTSDVTDAENLILQVLRDQYPDYRLSQGYALRDLVVRTLAYGLAYIRSVSNEQEKRATLGTLSLLEDESARTAADALVSNFLITRNAGGASAGVITVYLSSPVDVLVKSTTRFYKTSNVSFSIATGIDTIFPSSDLTVVNDVDGNPIEWFFSFAVTANNVGTSGDVEAGRWESWSPFNAYVTRIENGTSFASGTAIESNADLVSRARTAVTVRNQINDRAMSAQLMDQLSTVTKVVTVGAGDPEMQRDRITLGDLNIDVHVLGFMDTWVWLPYVEAQTTSGTISASGKVSLTSLNKPIYRITRAYYDPGSGEVDLDYTNESTVASGDYRLEYADPHKAFSSQQDVWVKTNTDIAGETLNIVYDTVTGLTDVDAIIEDPDHRVLCANPLAKAALPVFVDMSLSYTVRPDATTTISNTAVAQTIAEYINALDGEPLYVSNVIAYVLDTYPAMANVTTPLNINYTLWSTQGIKAEYTTTNKVEISEDFLTDPLVDPYPVPGDYSMSTRLMRFIASTSDITVTQAS